MSCSNCDCEDCDICCEDDDCEEETTSTFGRLPPAPPFSKTTADFKAAMDGVFDKYPNMRINMPMMVSVMLQSMNVGPVHFREAEEQCRAFLLANSQAGIISIIKGKNGGIMRPTFGTTSIPEMVKGKIESIKVEVKAEPTKAINDHTCPHCGNTSCSKAERSCWKCGGSL